MVYQTRSKVNNSNEKSIQTKAEKKVKSIKRGKRSQKEENGKVEVKKKRVGRKKKIEVEAEVEVEDIYSLAKKMFDRGNSKIYEISEIVGREDEIKELEAFWKDTTLNKKADSLYVCGQPGTGKSAMIKAFFNQDAIKKCRDYLVLNVNCVSLGKNHFFERIIELLKIEDEEADNKAEVLFDEYITNKRNPQLVLILDEIDYLLNEKNAELMYKIFSYVYKKKSKLVLIGIANDLTLTETSLPRLRTRGFSPNVIRFQPYTVEKMIKIVNQLMIPIEKTYIDSINNNDTDDNNINSNSVSGNKSKFFDPKAIELLCRKVSVSSGDLRKVLDCCKQAINVASLEFLMSDNTKIVNISTAHILKALAPTSTPPLIQSLKNLPMNSQLILIAALNLAGSSNRYFSITKLFEEYIRICKCDDLFNPVSKSEFNDLVNSLESMNFLKNKKEKKGKNNKIIISGWSNELGIAGFSIGLRDALLTIDLIKHLINPEIQPRNIE
ncbi:P-loop containing nucleoside triphosphate hydrolase protein [Neoconidiobolus thromboides FSU 785]|nr:P-loop containing nucleoside triphosphate hydrolase protein [Neoconidiobolus thromboides FSU 785]